MSGREDCGKTACPSGKARRAANASPQVARRRVAGASHRCRSVLARWARTRRAAPFSKRSRRKVPRCEDVMDPTMELGISYSRFSADDLPVN
jgi:hypothetical protein